MKGDYGDYLVVIVNSIVRKDTIVQTHFLFNRLLSEIFELRADNLLITLVSSSHAHSNYMYDYRKLFKKNN